MPGPPRQFDEDVVLETALKAFWDDGFEGTRLSSVLDEAGIGRQSLYNAFESKEALYVAALTRYRQRVMHGMAVTLRGEGRPSDRIRAVFEGLEDAVVDGDCSGCFMANAVAEFGKSNERVLAEVHQSVHELEEAFTHALDEAKAAGEASADLDSHAVARLCVTAVEGTSLLNRVQDGPEFAGAVKKGLLSLLGW